MLTDRAARLWASSAVAYLQQLWDRKDADIPQDPTACSELLFAYYDCSDEDTLKPEEAPAWLRSFAARFPVFATSWETRFILYGQLKSLAMEKRAVESKGETIEHVLGGVATDVEPSDSETEALLEILSAENDLVPQPSDSFLRTMESVRSPWTDRDKEFLKNLHSKLRSSGQTAPDRSLADQVAALIIAGIESTESESRSRATSQRLLKEFLEDLTTDQRRALMTSVQKIVIEDNTDGTEDAEPDLRFQLEQMIDEDRDP
ncbi:MAG: hypothetical protein GY906_14605 [bacterium]|nr:hypothetical protein [bacterium]